MAIPSVSTNEKFVIKFKLEPLLFRYINVIKNANGIAKVAIKDSLNPTKNTRQINTKNNVCNQLLAKVA
jgi:hypothetical protein